MNRLVTGIGAALFVTLLLCEAAVAAKIYVYDDSEKNQWCAIHDGSAFRAILKDMAPDDSAVLEYSNKHLSKIDEAGATEDFVVYDHYLLNEAGAITELDRRTNTFHGQVSMLENYRFENGRARKIETKFLDLVTQKPVPRPQLLSPDPDQPFYSRLNEFPFFTLLSNPATRTARKTCVAGK